MSDQDITENPYTLFDEWLSMAKAQEINDPTALCLATVGDDGRPSNRMVLLNGLDERGFVFYTNSHSRKGALIAANPYAALCFHWKTLRKQVRIEGKLSVVSTAESDAYFATRPRLSKIGAWASQQSSTLEKFSDLEEAVRTYEKKFEGIEDIPRPPHWHGYRLTPDYFEFWMDGAFRLHRRIIYRPHENGWSTSMLYP